MSMMSERVNTPADGDVAEDLFWCEESEAYVTYPEYMRVKYGIVDVNPEDDDND